MKKSRMKPKNNAKPLIVYSECVRNFCRFMRNFYRFMRNSNYSLLRLILNIIPFIIIYLFDNKKEIIIKRPNRACAR